MITHESTGDLISKQEHDNITCFINNQQLIPIERGLNHHIVLKRYSKTVLGCKVANRNEEVFAKSLLSNTVPMYLDR